jgi:pimeloyl-ACP methyl ester carboxylesterase
MTRVEAALPARTRAGTLDIAYEMSETGSQAMLFVHGFAADRTYFRPQLAQLSDSRKTVALDLRGHGLSSAATAATLDDFAEDVIAIADAAGLDSAVICGHSMAGVVGLKVALARPELVRGVAMIESTVLFPPEVRASALANLVPALAGEHGREALRGFFEGVILSRFDPPDLVQRVLGDVARISLELAHAFFASLWSSDYAAELQAARCPLLYIHTQAPTDLQRLRQLRPDALVGEVIGSGHYPHLTAPDQVNSMLKRFLELVEEARP